MRPISLLIKPVSGLCNMRCSYCFYSDVAGRREQASYGVMASDILETLVRKALAYAAGSCSFGFQGGEPTLAGLGFFEELLRLQKRYNVNNVRIHNAIQTNGYAMDGVWADFFSHNNFLVGLSIDGTKEIHDKYRCDANGQGTYDRALHAAELLQAAGAEFNVLCVINNDVAASPGEVYSNLKKYKYLQFIPCIDDFGTLPSNLKSGYGNFLKSVFDEYYKDAKGGNYVSVQNFENYIRIMQGRGPTMCAYAGVCTCYYLIEADGSCYPCDFYVLDEWRLGNIQTDNLSKMLKSDVAKKFIDMSNQPHRDCLACAWVNLCKGGCRRYREPSEGGAMSKNIHCDALKDFFGHAYEKMEELGKLFK
ncbi:MAG: anaerobic sulfatase maturase [Defluviitaleaceae bacterium]|nr:anaerobic sulfatase maturase [Defluviitaleaceae bacterium]